MKFTVGTAAKETGKAKSTISRYISKGKISAIKTKGGSYEIDAAELFRVFPKVERSNSSSNSQMERSATHKNTDETLVLEAKLEALQEERERERRQLEQTIEDLRRRLDAESEERRGLTLMLTDMRSKKKTVLDRIFGINQARRGS